LAQITLIRLQAAYSKVAALVVADPVFMPIFERLTGEIAAFEMQDDIVARARAVVSRQKAIA
jgi:hypothetical protein